MSLTHRTLFRILGLSALLAVLAVPASAQYSFGVVGKNSGMTRGLSDFNTAATLVPPPQIFDVSVDLINSNVFDGVGYVWEYKVTGINGNNKALSHWVLALCDGLANDLDMSFFDFNSPDYFWQSDRADALKDLYKVTPGFDPTTGVDGIKYDYISGGQLDADGEMEYFKFRLNSQHALATVQWGAKDGNTPNVYGTVQGPSCEPGTEIPEPTTLLMLALGLGGGALARRRRS